MDLVLNFLSSTPTGAGYQHLLDILTWIFGIVTGVGVVLAIVFCAIALTHSIVAKNTGERMEYKNWAKWCLLVGCVLIVLGGVALGFRDDITALFGGGTHF